MKNKPAHKKSSSHRAKPTSERTILWYTVIVFSLVLMVFANVGYKLSKPHVLGASTILLAEGGQDGSSGDSQSAPTVAPQSASPFPTISPMPASDGNQLPGVVQSPVSDSTPVDCVGPDGNHFTTEFHNCQELNAKWGNSTFTFTPLTKPQIQPETNDSQGSAELNTGENKLHQTIQTPQGKLEVQVDGSKKEVNLEAKGLHVELKTEDNGVVKIHATQANGTEVQLNTQDALSKLNEQLKNEDVQIGTSEGGLEITKGGVSAHTTFPLSVDPTTHQLTVTTPAGSKTVAVLPDKAVQDLLATGVLSGVASQGSTASTGAGTTQVVQLTQVNNEPAFAVQGVVSKKLLGIFPMSYAKTAYVSAQDGHTIQVSQSWLTSFLEAFSL